MVKQLKYRNMKAVLEFESIGRKHQNENGFFAFLVREKFSNVNSRVIQWCTIKDLTVTIEALTDQVVEWGMQTLKNGLETETGYRYVLKQKGNS
jgi:hypothetical protein